LVRSRHGLLDHDRSLGEKRDERVRVVAADLAAQLRVGEWAPELVEELLGRDQLELAGEPAGDQPCGAAPVGEQGCDRDVGGENRAQSAPATARRMLRLDGELDGLLLVHLVAAPESLEQIEAP
jgi:hypothetical protein